MKARFYRFIFENTSDAIIHSGFIWDNIYSKTTKFVYTAGVQKTGQVFCVQQDKLFSLQSEQRIDFYIVGAVTIMDLFCLIDTVEKTEVDTVILPYQTPAERMLIAEKLVGNGQICEDIRQYLKDPDGYLKSRGVCHVYFLEGNTPVDIQEKDEGVYFEPVEAQEQEWIFSMEGKEISVVKAGMVYHNHWCFCFGVYGAPLQTRYEQQTQLKELEQTLAYWGEANLLMYHGSAGDDIKGDFILQKARRFNVNEKCHVDIPFSGKSCALECMHYNDYDYLKSHNQKGARVFRNGMLLHANANMNLYIDKIMERYKVFGEKLRVYTVPNGGNQNEWNRHVLRIYSRNENRYWVCPCNENTSAEIIKQIEMDTIHQRFTALTEEKGLCFSGYIVPGGRE